MAVMGEDILVQKITKKHGSSANGPWTRTAVQDGNGEWLSTFDTNMVPDDAEGKRAHITSESKTVNGRIIRNLTSFQLIEESSIAARTEDGEVDWDLIGLRKTRCALWGSYLAGQLAAGLYVKASQVEGRDPIDHVVLIGKILVAAAERDTFEREPGDDGVPFDFDQGLPR